MVSYPLVNLAFFAMMLSTNSDPTLKLIACIIPKSIACSTNVNCFVA